MTSYGSTRETVRRPETGWAQARRRRNGRVRSCVPATADAETRSISAGPEGNIVRGED